MPVTLTNRPNHSLLELQEGHTKPKMVAGVTPHADANWTHTIASTSPQNWKGRNPNLPKLPQSGQISPPLSHHMHGVCTSEMAHGEPLEKSSQVHEYPTHQSEGFPATLQIHPQHELIWQSGQRHIDQSALGEHEPNEPELNSPTDHPMTLT